MEKGLTGSNAPGSQPTSASLEPVAMQVVGEDVVEIQNDKNLPMMCL